MVSKRGDIADRRGPVGFGKQGAVACVKRRLRGTGDRDLDVMFDSFARSRRSRRSPATAGPPCGTRTIRPLSVTSGNPMRIASTGDGAGVIGKRIEEQIGQREPRHVLGGIDALGEQNARRIDAERMAARMRRLSRDQALSRCQPQHRTWHAAQDRHPGGEHRFGDFVVIGETAEYETIFRQAHHRRATPVRQSPACCRWPDSWDRHRAAAADTARRMPAE